MNSQSGAVSTTLPSRELWSNKMLHISARLWFVITIIGQWLFAYYIAVFYGGTAIQGDFEEWTRRMIHGFIEGDYMGNAFVLLHILMAFIITFGGPLQFIPKLQQRYPLFHRLNGRVYILTAFIISLGGLYMIWSRPNTVGGIYGQIALTTNAIFIMGCASISVYYAIKRKISIHQRWAMRTFLTVSGVWFFRIGFGFWILINGGAPGSNETLTGPFDMFLYFACFLLPLLLFEIYVLAKPKAKTIGKWALSAGLFVLSLATAGGIFMAAQIFWLPNL
ncbi:DUF2306 domain-containing protein [Aquimarina mytili]|uniref:DUF2306 domain-containing protein n=1 Tax=Aquimarina mytili TaxID=874423 RepID=A0A936ZRC8_9FLAO|nr:DUF2306 domain-containing protein [Aquimarina mytili]MBL0683987.1 DUF2306 domain-containing protein [Aquimarina mytili]